MDHDHDPTDPTGPEAPTEPDASTEGTSRFDPPKRDKTPADRRHTLYVTLAIAVAIGALAAAGFSANTDDDAPPIVVSRPDVVEHLIPRSGAEVLRQAEIGIDLAPGYEAALLINGIEIPADDTRAVPEQNQVFFAPGEGKVIEELQGGQTCVVAVVWRSSQGRGVADQPFRWCFDVT